MAAAAISPARFAEGFRNAGLPIDFRPLLSALAMEMVAGCKKNIDESHAPDGTPYKPLAHPRPNSKGGDIPLLDSTRLQKSIVVIHVGDRGFVIGSNLDYAAIHNFGGRIVPKNAKYLAIPATKTAQQKGSPRNWVKGELKFTFGPRGGVARWKDAIQYYFTKSVEIPKREFIGVTDQQTDDMTELVADYVADKMVERLAASFGASS